MRAQSISNVSIVGGGPAGLATAIALAQAGYRATVIDRAIPPLSKACGEGLMPDSLAVLAQLGVTIPNGTGARFRGIRFSDAHSSVASDFPHGTGIGVPRLALHALLLQRAEELGVNCVWGARQVDLNGSQLTVNGRILPSDFFVAADGQNSIMRRASGMHEVVREHRRYGFRRHYRMAPWSRYMELYWGPKCQIYVTPIGADQVCVVSMAQRSSVRIDGALIHFPELRQRLKGAELISRDVGALSVSRKLRRVCREGFALVGDASGSVDAITGEGLCLCFKQALSLAKALRAGRLHEYQSEHNALSRRPQAMGALMLTLDKHAGFQRRALAGLAHSPQVFSSLLAVHVGERPFFDLLSRDLLNLCRAFVGTVTE